MDRVWLFASEEKRKKKGKGRRLGLLWLQRVTFANTQIIPCFSPPLLLLAGSTHEEIRAIYEKKRKKKANIFNDWSHKNKYVFLSPHSSWEAALLLAKRQAVMHPESPCKCWPGPRTECHLLEHRGGLSVPGWTLLLSCWSLSQQWAVSPAAEFAP